MKNYTKTHEWLEELEDGTIVIGLSDFAQSELGDIVFINLPEVGTAITVDAAFADVESVKAVSEIYAPVSGVISEVNADLLDNPGKVNEDAVNTWLVKVKEVTATTELLTYEQYLAIVS